jgi:hypothetical protein
MKLSSKSVTEKHKMKGMEVVGGFDSCNFRTCMRAFDLCSLMHSAALFVGRGERSGLILRLVTTLLVQDR